MLNKGLLIYLIVVLFNANSIAQNHGYMFPIKPGQINALSGSVGELRSTHFHTGLDIKTEGVEGLPVFASQDGYISRISVSPTGYGHALYIQHPDGNTTVYGHLQRFNETIATYVLKEQYRTKSFSLNRYPAKTKFPVKKGDIIAYSGNSGSSGGPHLHWDLRDAYQRPLNSLEMKWNEIRDTTPPVIESIALRTMNIHSRVNGLFGRFEFRVYKKGDTYYLNLPVALKGKIGLEILGYDKLDDSNNKCGISSFELYLNDDKIFQNDMHLLTFSKQRSIYTYYNYPARIQDGQRFHKLYIDEGNNLDFYDKSPSNGILDINNQSKSIRAILKDPYGNETILKIELGQEPYEMNIEHTKPGIQINQNILTFSANKSDNPTQIHVNGNNQTLKPYFQEENLSLFLYDLQEGMPDFILHNGKEYPTNLADFIKTGKAYNFYKDHVNISFPSDALFEDIFLTEEYSNVSDQELFTIGNPLIPLKKSIAVTLKPAGNYEGKGWSVYSTDNSGRYYYQGGSWSNHNIQFRTSYFGTFTIVQDITPPEITPVSMSKSKVMFRIKDNLSGIHTYDLKANGKWILMHYDPKTNRIWSEMENKDDTLAGELVLRVSDKEGNSTTFKYKL